MFQNRGKFSFDEKRRALLAIESSQCYLEYILHLILARFKIFFFCFVVCIDHENHSPLSFEARRT